MPQLPFPRNETFSNTYSANISFTVSEHNAAFLTLYKRHDAPPTSAENIKLSLQPSRLRFYVQIPRQVSEEQSSASYSTDMTGLDLGLIKTTMTLHLRGFTLGGGGPKCRSAEKRSEFDTI